MRKAVVLLLVLFSMVGCQKKETVSQAAPTPLADSAGDYLQDGRAKLLKGDVLRAVRIFQEAVERNPKDSRAYFVLGETFMRLHQYDKAIESFSTVTQLEDTNGHAYLLLGGCYDLEGDHEKAVDSVKKSVEIFRQKRDAVNFKAAAAVLQRLLETKTATQ